MKRTLLYVCLAFFILLGLLFWSFTADAQTVSPVITEYKGRVAKGEFTATNAGIVPLDIHIEPMSFTVDAAGQPHFTPLDTAHIHLKLDSLTAHLGAKQQRTFWYEVRCDQPECWGSLYVRFTGARTSSGMNVAVHLPSTFYL